MGNENSGRKMSKTVGHRKRLSDITNTPLLLKSGPHNENGQLSKTSSTQLQDELATVKMMLAEKEEIIEENKRCMEKLWINYCRKTKQNDEIILHNSQLYKDLMQARDKLKVLQHENAQMAALYKVCRSEMQKKLDEALEQVDRLTKVIEASALGKASSDKHCYAPTVLPADLNGLSCENLCEDYTSIHGRSTLRKRESKSYKEPSLRLKMRQSDGGSMCPGEPTQCDDNAAVQVLGKVKEFEESSVTDTSAISATCRSEIKASEGVASENGAHMKALQQWTGTSNVGKDQALQLPNTLHVSIRKSSERPHRRAASSIGSYKEPSLITKMRRAA
eukprot:c33722_g1_i1 orf=288-1289(-)